jgi:16S rRNA A1518/A1519 N6-dimethyltransferase RsmA/KsgA/DIM1 with predicted DNA glycosylase/AP lyase activity
MNSLQKKQRIEFGDFQTPDNLALTICAKLQAMGIQPEMLIEPTCGIGAFIVAAARVFPNAQKILGFEINNTYLEHLQKRLPDVPNPSRIILEQTDFFNTNWQEKLASIPENILILGNFPWVTNTTQSTMNSTNLPEKSNFLQHNGFEAISGKANFDISEWMLLKMMQCLENRTGDIAMLVKTTVARKILAHAQRQNIALRDAFIVNIDAKQHFGASVEACLLVMRLSSFSDNTNHDYTVFNNLDCTRGQRIGHRHGFTISNLVQFEQTKFLLGQSPQKWRSGIKHDAAAIMELTQTERGLENGLGEIVELEDTYLYPLLKGSDVGSGKAWRKKYVLVTQQFVGQATDTIRETAPRTWVYLEKHSQTLEARGSSIYIKNPPYSIFGIGDYAFRPWRIAICALYKVLRFRLVAPIENRPVMFDDTVYYLSFDTEAEAVSVLEKLNSKPVMDFLESLIFWNEKRPIKTGILNALDWTQVETVQHILAPPSNASRPMQNT